MSRIFPTIGFHRAARGFFSFERAHREGCKGKPAQAFKRPKTSRTTSSASPVERHQWSGANGSVGAARTIACPRPRESSLQSVRTLRVCTFVVTMITVSAFSRSSSAVIARISSAVSLIAGSITKIAFDGTPSCIKTRALKKSSPVYAICISWSEADGSTPRVSQTRGAKPALYSRAASRALTGIRPLSTTIACAFSKGSSTINQRPTPRKMIKTSAITPATIATRTAPARRCFPGFEAAALLFISKRAHRSVPRRCGQSHGCAIISLAGTLGEGSCGQ
jgi:hypothetical protein